MALEVATCSRKELVMALNIVNEAKDISYPDQNQKAGETLRTMDANEIDSRLTELEGEESPAETPVTPTE